MSFYKKCVLGANSFCKSLWCLSFCPVVGCRKYVVDAPMHSIRKTKHRCNIPFCKKQSFCKKNVVRNTSVNSRPLLVAILFTAHFLRPPHHSVLSSLLVMIFLCWGFVLFLARLVDSALPALEEDTACLTPYKTSCASFKNKSHLGASQTDQV